jgi:hypothetical protein
MSLQLTAIPPTWHTGSRSPPLPRKRQRHTRTAVVATAVMGASDLSRSTTTGAAQGKGLSAGAIAAPLRCAEQIARRYSKVLRSSGSSQRRNCLNSYLHTCLRELDGHVLVMPATAACGSP